MDELTTYQFEYEQRIRCAYIGAGGHSYRNVYPAFQYAPVDLVAVCDLDRGRAETYARMFGGARPYTDHREMLAREEPAAVFIVTAYDQATGRVQATDLAADCLAAGTHVWMEKPVAASVAEVEKLVRASADNGRFVVAGLKKMFTPAFAKVQAVVASEAFGPVSSISVRYPQSLPPPDQRPDLVAMRGFLDHIYHPAATLVGLLGPVRRFSYEWEPHTGGSVASLTFAGGAVGTLHLVAGIAQSSPLERLEVVGRDANVVVDNGVRVTYYRPVPAVRTAAPPRTWSTTRSRRWSGNRSSRSGSCTTRTCSISGTFPRSFTSAPASNQAGHPPKVRSATRWRSCSCSRPTNALRRESR